MKPGTRITRSFDVPASAVFAALNDPSRRAWSPEPLYRVVSALAPRFVRMALPDGSQVAVSIVRQGNSRCTVTVEVTGTADKGTAGNGTAGKATAHKDAANTAAARWRDGLRALAEQLDHWD